VSINDYQSSHDVPWLKSTLLLRFIKENPGRQSISGSFHPIDDGEWTEQAYIGESEKLCRAIQSFDRATVLRMINVDGVNVNRRDHVGRTPLHVAIISRASDIACDLIDVGSQMTARLADGRTALHLAAQSDLPDVARKLLQRSIINKEKAEAVKEADKKTQHMNEDDPMDGGDEDEEKDGDNDNSNDDWSSEGEDKEGKEDPKPDDPSKNINIFDHDDNDDSPDVLDANTPDWDLSLTPLGYAIISGSLDVLDELIVAGADPAHVAISGADQLHSLTLTILTEDEDRASRIIERLLQAGATSSTANMSLVSIFHRVVCARRPRLVSTLLRADPNAKLLVNFPSATFWNVIFPSVSAIERGDYATLALLLAYGAKLSYNGDDLQGARDALYARFLPVFCFVILSLSHYRQNQDAIQQDYLKVLHSPAETALARRDYIIRLLMELGADVSLPTKIGYSQGWENDCSTLVDWVDTGIRSIDEKISARTNKDKVMDALPSSMSGWKAYHQDFIRYLRKRLQTQSSGTGELRQMANQEKQDRLKLKEYLEYVKALFVANDSKPWKELSRDKAASSVPAKNLGNFWQVQPTDQTSYKRFTSIWSSMFVTQNQVDLYDQLFEACWDGDNGKIQELCLPKDASKSPQQPLQIVAITSEGGGFSLLFS
jgi:ankyrin repeat protein